MPEQDRWDAWWETDEGSADEARAFDKIMKHAEMTDAIRRCMHREPALRKPNANPQTNNTGTTPKLEQDTQHGPLAEGQAKEMAADRVHIRFESVRKRLLDPDNLCEKWTLDCLRYIGVIRGDEPDKITLETTQRKAAKGEAEHTLITITYPL